MDKQQSDNIENRFRQAAENFIPPPPSEEAWMKMEALLNKDPRKKRPLIWWWFFGLLGLLLAGGAGGYYYFHARQDAGVGATEKRAASINGHQAGSSSTMRKEAVPGNNAGEQKEAAGSPPVQEPASSPSSLKERAAIPATDPASRGAGAVTGSIRAEKSLGASTLIGGRAKGAKHATVRPSYGQGEHQSGSGTSGSSETPLENLSGSSTKAEVGEHTPGAFLNLPVFSGQLHPVAAVPDNTLGTLTAEAPITDSLQKAAEKLIRSSRDKGPKPARFYAVLAGSRNATNLRKFDTRNIGSVYGADIGYHVTSWLSVQTGFHASRKIYFAGAGDYKFHNPYWDSVKILKIDANCLIFDIPLSLRFDLVRKRNSGFYAIAGMSSFLMSTEDYNYHFNTASGWYRKTEMKYKGNMDWFSSINLSAGYEHRILRAFYLQAEPYAKLPVSGVGAGSIKLYSLGLQVGIKYQPGKK